MRFDFLLVLSSLVLDRRNAINHKGTMAAMLGLVRHPARMPIKIPTWYLKEIPFLIIRMQIRIINVETKNSNESQFTEDPIKANMG